MYEFNSIQEALSYMFEDKNITIINIPGTQHPWFLADDIRNALEYGMDNYQMTRILTFRDEVVATLNINNENLKPHINVVSNFGGARRHMIISLPGVFELIIKSRAPKAEDFQHWLYFTVLPGLYYNPQMAKELTDLKLSFENVTKMGTAYQQETYRLRRNYNDLCNKHNELAEGYKTLQTVNGSIGRKYFDLKEDYTALQDAYDELASRVPYDDQDIDYVYTLSV